MHLKYQCDECGAYGVRLWRDSNVCAKDTRLLCCPCARKDQVVHAPFRGDDIGHMVPAIPDKLPDAGWKLPSGAMWWTVGAISMEGATWWCSLLG